MTPSAITVQLLDGGHPLIRFPMAFATRAKQTVDGKYGVRLAGQLNVSLETFEEAITLRDALSSFIAFHQACDRERCRVCSVPIETGELCEKCAEGNDPFKTADNCGADLQR